MEVKEVLRLWLKGRGYRRVADQVQADRKTVRRYVEAAVSVGLDREGGEEQLTDELLGAMAEQLEGGRPGNAHGEAWRLLEGERAVLEAWLKEDLRLTKAHNLLARRGLLVPYRTLHRFWAAELGFGRARTTVRVADGEPGKEIRCGFPHRISSPGSCGISIVGPFPRRPAHGSQRGRSPRKRTCRAKLTKLCW